MTGEADESGLPFSFGSIKCFQEATFGVDQLWVVVVDDAMDLPEVQMSMSNSNPLWKLVASASVIVADFESSPM